MRALWIDRNNDPDWVKVAAYKMTALYFDMTDLRVHTSYLQNVQSRGYAAGVYVAPNWAGFEGDGRQFAEKVDAQLKLIVPIAGPSFPKVQMDIEKHDAQYVIDCLSRWRELRPNQDTSWTFEPNQTGWMSDELVVAVVANRVRIVPQYYLGGMQPVAADRELIRLIGRGFPVSSISGFYDAAALPYGWDGFAFTQGRLP